MAASGLRGIFLQHLIQPLGGTWGECDSKRLPLLPCVPAFRSRVLCHTFTLCTYHYNYRPFVFRSSLVCSFLKKIKNSFNNRRPDLFLATGRLNEGGRDHLKVSLCWKHQVMTFITNDLGPPAMNLDNTD